jgi:UDP-N-acetylmuramyl tripeptide synthase
VARAISGVSRWSGLGGGTALPGAVAWYIDHRIARVAGGTLRRPPILVTGTNGKTTTTHLVSASLTAAGLAVCTNRSGANLLGGIISALLAAPNSDAACFEVDEGTLAEAVADLSPEVVGVLNLFRDQLDRYGEVDAVARRLADAIANLSPSSRVVLNADDPAVASLAASAPGEVVTFGIEDPTAVGEAVGVQDFPDCRRCGALLRYDRRFVAHLGHYWCPVCHWRRPTPDVAVTSAHLRGLAGSSLRLTTPQGVATLDVRLLGLAGAYSVAAALAVSLASGVPLETAVGAIAAAPPAFARGETVRVPASGGERPVRLLLAKNPASFAELIRVLASETQPVAVVLAVNDRRADGTDVSWLWDVDVAPLARGASWLLAAGDRAEDVALRLKYVGRPGVELERTGWKALRRLVDEAPAEATPVFMGTYTVVLDLHRELERRGLARPFWAAPSGVGSPRAGR